MCKILVTGSKGQLGREIESLSAQFKKLSFTFTDVDELDITNTDAVNNLFQSENFDFVINCAAYTAVDKAESDKDLCYKINTLAPLFIGEAAKKTNSKVIHISTDYVFDGTNHKPYIETEKTNPQSYYGITKEKGEELLLISNPDSIVIRTSWLYSSYGNNFIKTMARLGQERDELSIVFDQVGSPTNAHDLALAILTIIDQTQESTSSFTPGIYHYSNEGVCSWYDFANVIFEILNIQCKTSPICSSQFPTPAPRPHYSVMDKSKIKSTYNLIIPYWQKSLKNSLENATWSF